MVGQLVAVLFYNLFNFKLSICVALRKVNVDFLIRKIPQLHQIKQPRRHCSGHCQGQLCLEPLPCFSVSSRAALALCEETVTRQTKVVGILLVGALPV